MTDRNVILAVEDQLSEIVTIRILNHFGIGIIQTLGLKGNNYLKDKTLNLNRTAKKLPVSMLNDLDSQKQCPPDLINSWLTEKQNPYFFFRIAVMEVESWVMADRKGFADFLSIPVNRIPQDTDSIEQPKEFLISLARLSRKKRLREDLIPAAGATSKVGPSYNPCLGEFMRTKWDIEAAFAVSGSLLRIIKRLQQFKAYD
jgi:hypothetical protein